MPTVLEDRVKALEEEVSILKDEIRNTLLEIQEQVLMHYYPELRARDAAPPEEALMVARAAEARRAAATFSGVQRFSAAELAEEQATDEAAAASAGAEAEAAQGALPALGRPAGGAPAAAEGWAEVARLMEWASASVARIGKERTVKAIEIAVETGYLDRQARDMLVRLVALSDGEPAAARVSLKAIGEVLQGLGRALGREADQATEQRFLQEVRLG